MRTRVTDSGVLLPKEMFDGVEEVEISKRDQTIVVEPVRARDPVYELGEDPIDDEVISRTGFQLGETEAELWIVWRKDRAGGAAGIGIRAGDGEVSLDERKLLRLSGEGNAHRSREHEWFERNE